MPGILDLPSSIMKIWKKLLLVDRVHLEFIGNASRYIHRHYTPTPLLLLFIPYKFLVRTMIKFRITKEKEEDAIKRPQQNVLSFFLSTKAYVKRSDVAYF